MFSPQFNGEQKQFWGICCSTNDDISLLSSNLGLTRPTKRKSSISVHTGNGSDCAALTGSHADDEGDIFTWASSRCSHFNVISHLLRRMFKWRFSYEFYCSVHCPSHLLDRETGILSSSWKKLQPGQKIILVSEVLSLLVLVVLVLSVTQLFLPEPDEFLPVPSPAEPFISECHPSCQLKQVKTPLQHFWER